MRLSIDAFRARVQEILSSEMKPAGDEMGHALEKIHQEDLFLAIACAQSDRVAWEHFADDYFPLLRHFAVKACGNITEGEDLTQEITARLLNEKQRLAGYNGRGSLAGQRVKTTNQRWVQGIDYPLPLITMCREAFPFAQPNWMWCSRPNHRKVLFNQVQTHLLHLSSGKSPLGRAFVQFRLRQLRHR